MSFNDLTDEQQRAFFARVEEFKIKPDTVVPRICSSLNEGPTILSVDPRESAIPPQIYTFEDLDEMKRLMGNCNEDYENGTMDMHHEILPDWPQDKNGLSEDELDPEENNAIEYAFKAYLFGHSKYYASYKKIIEAQKFPMKYLVFAAKDVCLDAKNSPLIVKAGSGLCFGTLKIYEGGYIKFEAAAHLIVQKMEKLTTTDCPAGG